jgi:Mrp family chromosome partitioning ATPase
MPRVPTIPQSLRRACRDVLSTASHANGSGVIGLISSSPAEGVSTIAVGLARILAETSNVLLVDASGGHPVSQLMEIDDMPLGAEELAHPHLLNLNDWIIPCAGLHFDLLTLEVGQLSAVTWERRWAALKPMLMKRYQIVVIDLGSLQTQFSPFWSACLDHTYLVVDMSRTNVDALYRARRELDFLRMPVTGAILNRRTFSVPAFLGGERS